MVFVLLELLQELPQIFTIFLVEARRYAIYNLTLMLVYLIDVDHMIEYLNAKWFGFDSKHNMLD